MSPDRFTMDYSFFLSFFITVPLCGLLLWFWKLRLQKKPFTPATCIQGIAVLLFTLLLIWPLSLVQYLPNFITYRGLFFSYLNHTFNASLLSYIVLFFRCPDSKRILPVSICFMILNVFISYGLSMLRNMGNGIGIQFLVYTIQGLYIFLFVVIIDGFHITRNVMTWSIMALTKDLAANIYKLMLNAAGIDDFSTVALFPELPLFATFLIQHLFYIFVYGLIASVAAKADRNSESISTPRALIIGITVLIVTGPLYAVIRNYQQVSMTISVCMKLLYIMIYVLLLIIRFGMNQRASLDSELLITRQLLHQEQKHYETVRDNIDLVNMRCHDINRQLKNLQNKLTENELASLQEAIHIYDSNIRTGSEICDMVLYQKSLFCQKKGIRLSYIIDGKALRFIRNADLYALLTNILDNAFEAVVKLDNPEKWIVDLTVSATNDFVTVETNNFFDVMSYDETARTAKADAVHHGYGLKSIQYIVSEYGGVVNISTMDDIFTVQIRIPMHKVHQADCK